MKKIELLSPAGNMEALVAAVQAGCDAVYIGGKSFGARAFSKNFNDDEIIEAINYAHLYGVKVYITVNTLIYDNEVDDLIKYIEFIHLHGVDAVIMQDIGMIDLIRKKFPLLEIHASTQMHVHNLDGVKFAKDLGIKRVVLARETDIDTIKYIRDNCDLDIEVFIHGALCISYSGQCLMSSLIGGRSGNRGVCAGSCRLKYDIVDDDDNVYNKYSYPLSTKDLNTLDYIGELIDSGVCSLKIEGRMKSCEYVYMVTKLYRQAIDNYYKYGCVKYSQEDLIKLKKIFNREYTKGFLFKAFNHDIINGYRPNNMGVLVGNVINYNNGYVTIKLIDRISYGCGLRVVGHNKDVGISVNEIYLNNKLVKVAYSGDVVKIKINDKVEVNDKVLITQDKIIQDEVFDEINNNLRKVLINGVFIGHIGSKMRLIIDDGVNSVIVDGCDVDVAKNRPISKSNIFDKLNKLGDSVYKFNNIEFDIDENIFINVKDINDIRRRAISLLNEKRMFIKDIEYGDYYIDVPDFPYEKKRCCLVDKYSDYIKLGKKYDVVYSYEENKDCILKIPRVTCEYICKDNVMIGDVGGLYKQKNCVSDFSLNVTNIYTVALLHSLGIKKVTLSYEMNEDEIYNLVNNYHNTFNKHPNLEVIVYGYPEAMISKYNLEKDFKKENIYLRDMFNNKYKIKVRNNIMYIYFYKIRDYRDIDFYSMGINSLRDNYDV